MTDDPAVSPDDARPADSSDDPAEADRNSVETDGTDDPENGGGDEREATSGTTAATESATTAESTAATESATTSEPVDATESVAGNGSQTAESDVPEDVRKYAKFQKMNGAEYDRVNQFLRDRTYVTAREWAIARLCADFRTETGVEMTKIGENLPRLIPFMTDTYTPQAVNQARSSFEDKVRKAGATFLYGAMCGFFTAEDLDDMMYEVTEVAKFLLEVEGVDLTVDEELEAEERISSVMREVRRESAQLRAEEVECPECGHVHEP